MTDRLDALCAEFKEHETLVSGSRYRDRILFLVENPNLAFAKFHDYGIKPCCWGTTVFVLGANNIIKKLWQDAGYALDDYSDALGDYVCIPDDHKPGYVGEEPMRLFQETLLPSGPKPDSVVSWFWDANNIETIGFRLRHSGIYLGKNSNRDVFFHQTCEGGRFSIGRIDEFEKDLPQKSGALIETIEKKFYMSLVTI